MPILRELLQDSRDGEWGKGEGFAGGVEMAVIRGTDFASVRVGDVGRVPVRYLLGKHAARKVLRPWDILLETAGGTSDQPTGRTLLLTPSLLEAFILPVTCASFARFLRICPGKADPSFVFWLLQNEYISGHIRKFHTQHTGVARFQFTIFADTHQLVLPERAVQESIAAFLSAFDSLIEVNHRRIAILEEMARRLFDDAMGPEVAGAGSRELEIPLPPAWSRRGLYDVAEVTFGFPFKSNLFGTAELGMRVVRIRDIPAGRTTTWTTEACDARYEVCNGDILIGMDGNFHTDIWSGGPALLNQRVTLLRPKPGRSTLWLLRAVVPSIRHLEATITGTTVAHLSARDLRALELACPPPNVQQRLDQLLGPIGEQVVGLKVANQKLTRARDLLLPKLISGEITVGLAERDLEDAA